MLLTAGVRVANPNALDNAQIEGSFEVYDATDESIGVVIKFKDSKNKIIFGKPDGELNLDNA